MDDVYNKELLDSIINLAKNLVSTDRIFDWKSLNTSRISSGNKGIALTIKDSIPPMYHSAVDSFADTLDSLIESGKTDQAGAAEVANAYLDTWNYINTIQNDTLRNAAQAALGSAGADVFSYTGQESIIAEIEKTEFGDTEQGQAVIEAIRKIPVKAANLITEYATLTDNLAEGLSEATEAMQKLSSGLDLEDVTKMISTYGMKWEDFQFIDGKYYSTNVEAIIEKFQVGDTGGALRHIGTSPFGRRLHGGDFPERP